MRLWKQTSFDFSSWGRLGLSVSGVLTLLALATFVRPGPKLGIDFAGGHLLRVRFEGRPALADLRARLGKLGEVQIQDAAGTTEARPGRDTSEVLIRFGGGEHQLQEAARILREEFAQARPEILGSEFVGPAVGRHLIRQAGWAVIGSLAGIVVYVAFRFRSLVWGAAAVLALFHDLILAAGFLNALRMEWTLTVIAGLLTLAGYSVNDTVVIFDRLRENLRLKGRLPFSDLVNLSLNETLSRTVITGLTTLFGAGCLLIWGGPVLRDFSRLLIFGLVVGTYSSLFVATPLVQIFTRR